MEQKLVFSKFQCAEKVRSELLWRYPDASIITRKNFFANVAYIIRTKTKDGLDDWIGIFDECLTIFGNSISRHDTKDEFTTMPCDLYS